MAECRDLPQFLEGLVNPGIMGAGPDTIRLDDPDQVIFYLFWGISEPVDVGVCGLDRLRRLRIRHADGGHRTHP